MHEANLFRKQLRQTAKHYRSIQLHMRFASCHQGWLRDLSERQHVNMHGRSEQKREEVQRKHGLAGMLARACTTSGRTSSSAGHHVMCRKDVKFFNTFVTTMLKIGVDSCKAVLT